MRFHNYSGNRAMIGQPAQPQGPMNRAHRRFIGLPRGKQGRSTLSLQDD
ncbi:MAG TPA: hypothetical protein VFA09_05830 [Ktedonobacteraceae bacterium]|nr:hypothetical protein [Ktedonobacteraceae bacterium]